jgi:hypothetical protein
LLFLPLLLRLKKGGVGGGAGKQMITKLHFDQKGIGLVDIINHPVQKQKRSINHRSSCKRLRNEYTMQQYDDVQWLWRYNNPSAIPE